MFWICLAYTCGDACCLLNCCSLNQSSKALLTLRVTWVDWSELQTVRNVSVPVASTTISMMSAKTFIITPSLRCLETGHLATILRFFRSIFCKCYRTVIYDIPDRYIDFLPVSKCSCSWMLSLWMCNRKKSLVGPGSCWLNVCKCRRIVFILPILAVVQRKDLGQTRKQESSGWVLGTDIFHVVM